MATRRLPHQQLLSGKALPSLIIIATIALQGYAALLRMACNSAAIPVFCAVPSDPALYPFLDYPMYSSAKKEGVTVPQYALTAIFEEGQEKPLQPEDFGLSLYHFNTRLVPAFRSQKTEKMADYIAAYKAAGNPPFTAIRLENNRLKITEDGVQLGNPDVFVQKFPENLPNSLPNSLPDNLGEN